jgi:hypothetical protein
MVVHMVVPVAQEGLTANQRQERKAQRIGEAVGRTWWTSASVRTYGAIARVG